MNGTVYVYKTSPTTLESDIEKVLSTPDFQDLNPEKETLIKINANYDRDWPGCNTSRWFLDAVLKNLIKKGFYDLKVIEGDLKLQPALKTIKAVGIDIYREKYHNMLSEKLLELVKNVKVFSIVDGTVGLEGGSMRMGNPVKTDLIIASWDTIAIDVIAAKVMGFPIEEVPYLKLAREEGMINYIGIIGDFLEGNLPQYDFAYKNSMLSNLDLWLRGNRITGRLFGYGSFFDRFGNHARRIYTGYVYHRKKKKVLNGDWREYEKG